jgi:hypothetical protein
MVLRVPTDLHFGCESSKRVQCGEPHVFGAESVSAGHGCDGRIARNKDEEDKAGIRDADRCVSDLGRASPAAEALQEVSMNKLRIALILLAYLLPCTR